VNRRTSPTTQTAGGYQRNDSINARCRQPHQISRIYALRLADAPAGQSIESERRLDLRQLQPRRLLRFDRLNVQIVERIDQQHTAVKP